MAAKEIFGRNVRPGMVPGGLAARWNGTREARQKRAALLGSNSEAIKEAASVVLEKRGFHRNLPNGFDRAAQPPR